MGLRFGYSYGYAGQANTLAQQAIAALSGVNFITEEGDTFQAEDGQPLTTE